MDYPIYEDKRSNGFATAALVLGIVGIATGCCVYTGIICGALAIIFALLSRGGEMTMTTKAKLGLIFGIIGIVFGVTMLIASFVIVISQFGSFENYMNYYYELMNMDMSTYPYSW